MRIIGPAAAILKSTVKAVSGAVDTAKAAVTPTPRHVCDPSGFWCDCARRREINAGGREPRWLDSRGWRERGRWLR